jgi:hypothetical protein
MLDANAYSRASLINSAVIPSSGGEEIKKKIQEMQ